MFEVDFHILNQKATPAIYADILAARPAAGFAGRLFVATDSPYGVFRDTGSAWVQVASNGGGGGGSTGVNGLNGTTNIGLGGTLTGNTTIQGAFDFSLVNLKNTTISSVGLNGISAINLNESSYYSLVGDNITIYQTYFYQQTRRFYTTYQGNQFGLNLDDNTGKFAIGDYGNGRKYNSFVVNDDTSEFYITTSFNQANTAQDLFYAFNISSGSRGIYLGDFNFYLNGTSFIIDDANESINSANQGASKGFSLDFAAELYNIGDNNAKITCDNLSQSISLTTNNLLLSGTITSSTAIQPIPAIFLNVTINGTPYKINLLT
jgi:hypothetical protein